MPSRGFAAAVVVLLPLLAGCGLGAERSKADLSVKVGVGDVVRQKFGGSFLEVADSPHVVYVPTGALHVDLDPPKAVQQNGDGEYGLGQAKATGDAEVVGVAWSFEDIGVYPTGVEEVLHQQEQSKIQRGTDTGPGLLRLAVAAGGTTTAIPLKPDDFASDSGAVWVGVPKGRNARLEVEYDGLTQTVDLATGEVMDPGAAAPLARLARDDTGGAPSGEPSAMGGRDSLDRAKDHDGMVTSFSAIPHQAVEVPYVAGVGWAPEGRTYVGMQGSMDVFAAWWVRDGDVLSEYRPTKISATWTLDGADSVSSVAFYSDSDRLYTFLASPAASHRVGVEAIAQIVRRSGSAGPKATTARKRATYTVTRWP